MKIKIITIENLHKLKIELVQIKSLDNENIKSL